MERVRFFVSETLFSIRNKPPAQNEPFGLYKPLISRRAGAHVRGYI